jgi:hypothetical protein
MQPAGRLIIHKLQPPSKFYMSLSYATFWQMKPTWKYCDNGSTNLIDNQKYFDQINFSAAVVTQYSGTVRVIRCKI